MSVRELGRVVDPSALDAEDGPRGRVRIEIPSEWLGEACALEIVMPARIACARCDGGGCDGCDRSGAFCAPDAVEVRTIRATLPGTKERALALRLARPFGITSRIEQLVLEVHGGERATSGVRRLERPAPSIAARSSLGLIALLLLLGTILLLAWAIAR